MLCNLLKIDLLELTDKRLSLENWEDFFKNAYSVDFFSSSMGNKQRVLRSQFYGKEKPAYNYLAPKYCPTSYFSAKVF